MTILPRSTQPTNIDTLDPEFSPAGWPGWTLDRIELDPSPSAEDEAWWALHAPSNADCYDVEDLDEAAAVESAALDAIERSLIPADLALAINRTSLAGSADAILHEGSLPSQCPCLPCTLDRTARYAE